MYPRSRIQQLNARRELTRRLKFVKQRIPETILEHHFFRGELAVLPEDMNTPPRWAQEAAKVAWDEGLGGILARVDPDQIKKDPRGAVRELIAIQETLLAYINCPSLRRELAEIGDQDLIQFKEFLSRDVGKVLLQHTRQLDTRLSDLLPPPSHADLIEYNTRALRSTRALAQEEDSFLGARTMTAKICYIIWFFWPEWAKKERTARTLHRWLSSDLGVFASEKTVEAIFTRIRMSGTPRTPRAT